MTTTRPARSDEDLRAYVELWNTVTPDESSTVEQQRKRRERDPRRLYVVAEREGELVGCGYAGPSDTPDRGFLAPRVLPDARRQGIGTALLRELAAHLTTLEFVSMSSHLDGADAGSLAFALRHGFEEVDRQVEQVKLIGSESAGVPPDGITFTTLADRPELLRQSYDLAVEGYADMATYAPVTITLDDWLDGDGGDVPAGTFAALASDDVVGFSGLCAMPGGGFEDGLTVVRRDWRRRGLAEALKRAKLAWAAENGVAEIVTWTQRGNEGMRALNERLGYGYRSVSISVRAPLESVRLER
jgi:L-amino acid N-acyltransferase YncA